MYMICSEYIRNPKILTKYENTKYTMNTTYMIQVPTETFGSSVSMLFRIQSVLEPEFCFLEDTQQVHIHLEKTLTMCMDASLKGYCACWTGWHGLLQEGQNSLSLFITSFGPECQVPVLSCILSLWLPVLKKLSVQGDAKNSQCMLSCFKCRAWQIGLFVPLIFKGSAQMLFTPHSQSVWTRPVPQRLLLENLVPTHQFYPVGTNDEQNSFRKNPVV